MQFETDLRYVVQTEVLASNRSNTINIGYAQAILHVLSQAERYAFRSLQFLALNRYFKDVRGD